MDAVTGTLKVTERVKLLAWEDAVLDRAVFVSLVLPGDVHTIEDLASRINLGDVIDAVRKSDEKLPMERRAAAPDTGKALEAAPAGDEDSFDLPPALRSMRFVFPSAFYVSVTKELFTKGGFGVLKGYMVGTGDGGPMAKLGLLGRAQVEERTSDTTHPFFLATLLQAMRVLADEIYRRMVAPAKIREAFDDLNDQLVTWTARLLSGVRRNRTALRLLANPLAPFALRRASPPPDVGDLVQQVLETSNPYRLTPALVRDLDEHFAGQLAGLLEEPETAEGLHDRVNDVLGVWHDRAIYDELEAAARRKAFLILSGLFVLVAVGSILPWLLSPAAWPEIRHKLADPDFLARAFLAIGIGGAAATTVGLLGAGWMYWRRLMSAVCRRWRRTSRALKKRREVARHLPGRAWRPGVPKLLETYRKFKSDCLDYHTLAHLPLPPLDNSEMYAEWELRDKWGQNAAVCYDDVYPSLILGTANRAAVYFIDVVGSTEMSTQQTLSNALEIYGRMLKVANETGIEPLWRKEVGDGRIYCHPAMDAFKRAILSVQGAAHQKVGLGIGIGLSVGEIYRDVTTGDFLNEVTNRAARLNARDDAIADYMRARYAKHPHRVHVKWGRLYNAGIAIDEKALRELGGGSLDSAPPGVPFLWKFPVMMEGHVAGSVSYFVERMESAVFAELLQTVGAGPKFERYWQAGQAVAFEVFCHKSEANLHYPTPLEGRTPAEYLQLRGIETVAFAAQLIEHDIPVRRIPITLSTGEIVNLAVKREKAHLKGLAPAAIAEVEVPAVMLRDDTIRLAEFLAGL
ncbi:MAG: hypothetical protein AAB152_01580 [Candidatus Coatesbacteria bacterium]